jgi:RNA polymerase sigma-70 factor (ECF subfamily)
LLQPGDVTASQDMSGREDSGNPAPTFETTQWMVVTRAGGDDARGREALAGLCRAYWLPLYVYVRRRGYRAHDAEDLTQGFFADLLERGAIRRADPARGRFRTFLLTALTNFMHNAHDRATAARRGGTMERLSFDSAEAAEALALIEAGELTPDLAFDRCWALAVLDRALQRLRAEQARLGKTLWFERVRSFLQTGAAAGDYAAIAAEFGLTKNAVAVAVHRLHARYRELVCAEIAETVSGTGEIEAELRELLDSV